MNWLRIAHETSYRYAKAMRFGPHRLVLRPREGHDVRVEEMRLHVEPAGDVEWSRDLFGNSVATVHFLERAEKLRIRSEVLIEQTRPFPQRSTGRLAPVPFPVEFSGEEAAIAGAYQTTTFPQDVGRVTAWAKEAIALDPARGAEAIVAQVTEVIRRTFKYRRREEKGVQSPTETLEKESGSCRDLATLMLEVLRVLGLPARFASGYLDCAASEAGRASTHAWAEAYLPEIGWTGYDPTLGEPTSAKHVVTGVSTHPRGVMPVSGIYYGEADAYLGMEVTVQTQKLESPPERNRAVEAMRGAVVDGARGESAS